MRKCNWCENKAVHVSYQGGGKDPDHCYKAACNNHLFQLETWVAIFNRQNLMSLKKI